MILLIFSEFVYVLTNYSYTVYSMFFKSVRSYCHHLPFFSGPQQEHLLRYSH